MDKLDKLAPKKTSALKDRPIAQGIVSNTIFQIVWNGLYFMIAWLVNHYALIYGIPPFLAILLAVFTFFLMSLSVNLLRRRKETKALNSLDVAVPPDFEEVRQLKLEIERLHGELVSEAESAEVREKELQSENREIARQNTQLLHDLKGARESKLESERDFQQARNKVKDVTGELDNYELQLKTASLEKNMLKEELEKAQREAKQANLRANQEENQRTEFYRLFNDRERELATWKPVLDQAKEQAAKIDEWVKMKTAIPGKFIFAKTSRLLTLEIRIYNESLYPVTINYKKITGSLRFKAIPLREEIQAPPDEPPIEVEPRSPALIKLLQPLRVFEAENIQESLEIQDNNGLVWLGDLYIPISAKDTPVPVGTKPLVIIPEHISLNIHAFSYNK